MSEERSWIAASAVAIILTAALLPAHLLASSGWSSAVSGLTLESCRFLILFLAGIIAVALLSGYVLITLMCRTQQDSYVGRAGRGIAVWLSLTGLSPLQPAVDTTISLSILSVLFASGLQPDPSPFLMPLIAVILFGLALGAEVSLRAADRDDDRSVTDRLRGLLSEVSPQLTGRLVMMVMFSAVIFGAGRRWMQLADSPISPDGREIFGAVLVMLALAFVLWAAGRNTRSAPQATNTASTNGMPAWVAWLMIGIILLLPIVGAYMSPDPLHVDPGARLRGPERIMGSWGTDELGRDLQARLFQAWQNAVVYGAAAAAFAVALALPIALGMRRECSLCCHIIAVLRRIPPPILFVFGWGATGTLSGLTLASVAVGVALALAPQAAHLLADDGSKPAVAAVLVLSGFLLVLGWEVALGTIGLASGRPQATFGGLIAGARQHITTTPWMVQFISGLFLLVSFLGTTSLYALVSTYGLPRRHTFLRG